MQERTSVRLHKAAGFGDDALVLRPEPCALVLAIENFFVEDVLMRTFHCATRKVDAIKQKDGVFGCRHGVGVELNMSSLTSCSGRDIK